MYGKELARHGNPHAVAALAAQLVVGHEARGALDRLLVGLVLHEALDELDRLNPRHRQVIELRFFGGLTPGEIAELMSRREGTIRALQFRALGALRRHLEEAGVAPERIAAPAPAATTLHAPKPAGGEAKTEKKPKKRRPSSNKSTCNLRS